MQAHCSASRPSGGSLRPAAYDLLEREAAETLARAESAANFGTFSYDFNRDALEWSRQALHILGFDPGSGPAKPSAALDAIHPEGRAAFAEGILAALAGKAQALTCRIIAVDGSERHLTVHLSLARDEHGMPRRLQGIAVDTTEHQRLEALLSDAQRLEGVGRLAGGIAHDFNNLLLVILATTELARRESRNPAVEPELDRIEEAAIRAADLVRQLLIFARGRPNQPELLDLTKVLPQTARLLERVLGDEVELDLRLPEGTVLWPIVADRGQIEQVVLNLAINAKDAMPDGGRIEISARNAAPGEAQHGVDRPSVVLAIRDSGSGMDPATLERIFEPFFSTKSWGTGLGLATCKTIVERAGGFIRARSAAGSGSVFELVFPRASGNPFEATPTRPPTLAVGSERVLVVDDSEAVRAVARRLLRLLGYEVVTARSASEARVALASQSSPIDLLITDLAMPRENGAAFARRVRTVHPGLRVLLVSARAHAVEELEQEFGPILAKPFTLEQLANAVRAALEARSE